LKNNSETHNRTRLHAICLRLFTLAVSILIGLPISHSQEDTTKPINDSPVVLLSSDSIIPDTSGLTLAPDSLLIVSDSLSADASSGMLKSAVQYRANDSIRFDLTSQKVYLYDQNDLTYEQINLKANYVEIDFVSKTVYARGVPDSLGIVQGNPEFKEGAQQFRSKEMRYSFETRKGLIKEVITQEGDGYLHGAVIKKLPDDVINIRQGKYTTCSLDHPHFEFRFSRSKVIPGNKIITGPAYLVIDDVPLPLALPFGLFPNKKGQRSGLLIPTYGESANRGFYFENFGYYWGINDYVDLELRGDIYTRGSWAIKTKSTYNKRYKYRGGLAFKYAMNILGEEGAPDYSRSRDFAINWSHQQSEKARPNSRFSSNVNIVSSKFNQFNPVSANDYLSNTFQSSVSYQTQWSNKYFLTASLNHQQNVITRAFSLTLPEMSFSVSRFHPFRPATRAGKKKWYDDISVEYRMNTRNQIQTFDTLLFEPDIWKRFQSGAQHSIPIRNSFKLLKYFNLTNTLTYTERWYPRQIRRAWSDEPWINGQDTIIGRVVRDTVSGFFPVRDAGFSSSLTTKLYGLVRFQKGPVTAVRHVVTPTISFNYTPDFGKSIFGYYDAYTDGNGKTQRYTLYEGGIYGVPMDGKMGRVNFSIGNNLEMKVRSRKDTISGEKKVMLIENLTITTAYDLARDSLRWSLINISGRTRLFKKLDLTYGSTWDPYVLDDSKTRNLNRFEWRENGRLLRFQNAYYNFSLDYSLNDKALSRPRESSAGSEDELEEVNRNLDQYVDFNVPWNLSFSYSLNIRTDFDAIQEKTTRDVVQTLNVAGEVNLTPKWKVGMRTGYDFKNKDFSYTTVDVYRDLHCWEMRFNWIPLGWRKSWNFTINVKSSLLQDLKLNKKKDFRDF